MNMFDNNTPIYKSSGEIGMFFSTFEYIKKKRAPEGGVTPLAILWGKTHPSWVAHGERVKRKRGTVARASDQKVTAPSFLRNF